MIDAKFSESTSDFVPEFTTTGENFTASMDEMPGGITLDHNRLINRDAKNSHPIESITGLNEQLNSMPNETLNNIELEMLLK